MLYTMLNTYAYYVWILRYGIIKKVYSLRGILKLLFYNDILKFQRVWVFIIQHTKKPPQIMIKYIHDQLKSAVFQKKQYLKMCALILKILWEHALKKVWDIEERSKI